MRGSRAYRSRSLIVVACDARRGRNDPDGRSPYQGRPAFGGGTELGAPFGLPVGIMKG
jgi:hypothetical protein